MSTKWQSVTRKKREHLRKPGIVVDKSYLHMFSPSDAEVLSDSYLVLMSETLLYEVSKDEENRSNLFRKVREYSSNFAYVEHYHTYIEFERRHIKKSPSPSHFFKDRDYSGFDLMVRNEFADVSELIENRRNLIEKTADSVIELAKTLRKSYPKAFTGRNQVAALERDNLEKRLANDQAFVREFLSKNAIIAFGEEQEIAAKIASKATEQWAHYRVTQTVLLLAIDVAHRQNLKEPISATTRNNIIHDVLDSQILTLATLVDAIAIRDEKIQRWWHLLMRKPVDFGRKIQALE